MVRFLLVFDYYRGGIVHKGLYGNCFSSPLRTGSVRERTIALSWGTSWREIHAFHTLVRISPSFFSLTKTHPFSHCTVRIDSVRMMGRTTM